jgi:hypothetical protein
VQFQLHQSSELFMIVTRVTCGVLTVRAILITARNNAGWLGLGLGTGVRRGGLEGYAVGGGVDVQGGVADEAGQGQAAFFG